MQLFGFIGVIALAALFSLSNFQIVPESAIRQADANESDLVLSATPLSSTKKARTQANSRKASTAAVEATFQPAVITSQTAQNIEVSAALLRGEVVVGTETIGSVFFIYGYDKQALDRNIATHKTYEQVLTNKHRTVVVNRVASSLTRNKTFTTRASSLAPDTKYYVRLCAERADQLSCSPVTTFTTIPRAYRIGDVRIPSLWVTDETATAADEMIIEMTVTMNDAVEGDIYLVYGESRDLVNEARGQAFSRINEDDERLQKTRIARPVRGTIRLSKTVDDLEEDILLYYIVCVEYDGLRDGIVCTSTQTYLTHDEDFGTSPRVQTTAVTLNGNQARLTGSVQMHNLNDGKVFFVYGSDLERITKVGGETAMDRLHQTQDRFQRVLVDRDLDGSDEYTKTVSDLQPGTLYAVRLCVEYENQNENYREVAFVTCGELRSFIAP